jgi:hypothetical protein
MADEPIQIDLVAQLGPLVGSAPGGLDLYAEQLTVYLARNLEVFADVRGGDLFLAVVVHRGAESVGREYRSGHYAPLTAGQSDG